MCRAATRPNRGLVVAVQTHYYPRFGKLSKKPISEYNLYVNYI